MSEVILFGEPMVMFTAGTPGPLEDVEVFTRYLAGAEVNVAIGLRRLEHTAAYITRLGMDPLGRYIKKKLELECLETHIKWDSSHWTGFQLKNKVTEGDPEVCYFRANSAASHMTEEDIAEVDLSGAQILHITGIPPALSPECREAARALVSRARNQGLTISFDPNLRPSLWESREVMVGTLNQIAEEADIVLPGAGEGEILMGNRDPQAIASFYRDLGARMVVVKAGPRGAYLSSENEEGYCPGYFVEQVVDTVGAGDGFAVGILSGVLEGLPVHDIVMRGNAIGAMQVMTASDNEGLPTRAELQAFQSRYKI